MREGLRPRRLSLLDFRLFDCLGRGSPSLLESFHSASGVYDFFIAGEERVASAADLNMDVFLGRAHGKNITARAADFGIGIILWMYVFFHLP